MIGRRRRTVLGVALSADAVRALLLKDGQVTWAHESPVGPDGTMEVSLREVLAEAPRSRRSRLPVVVAVGPTHAQLRHLHNLPAVRDARTLTAIVQQSAGRYFRQNGTPMITTPIAAREPHAGWAGAIEAPVVQAIVDACRLERFNAMTLVPTAAVLGSAVPGGHFTWHDGDVALELQYDASELRGCRCLPSHLAPPSPAGDLALDAPLRAMGADALRFADAYAAARGGMASSLALRPGRGVDERGPSATRLAVAATACLVSLALIVVAPAISAARQERIASQRLATLSGAGASALIVQRALADSSRLLSELAAFQRGAPSTVLLLASLTRAIDAPTMLVNLRLDADGGMLTALTPSAATLLAMLESVPEITAPTISGSVTPESPMPGPLSTPMGAPPGAASTVPAPPGRKLERVTVRFHWQGERRTTAAASRGVR